MNGTASDPGDNRRWWLVSASNVGCTRIYEAVNQRQAKAALRRDLIDAEQTNRRSRREAELFARLNEYEAAGPLTSEEAFDIEFGWALGQVVHRWSAVRQEPDAAATVDEARRYGLSEEKIERLREQTASRYAKPAEEQNR